MDSLAYLDNFIEKIDNKTLFHCWNPDYFSEIRTTLREVLIDLLFHRRGEVERERGINTIYALFCQRKAFFTSRVTSHAHAESNRESNPKPPLESEERVTSKQAQLFLAFLPFPGQWEWLDRVSKHFKEDDEVKNFLEKERHRIQRKLDKKRNKTFHLKDFCQILKPPSLPMEKGVLRIFSIPYLFFSVPDLLKKINQSYFIYVEPAAGINFRHEWLRVYAGLEDPVLFGLSSPEDRQFIGSQSGTLTTALAHGDYLEPLPEISSRNRSEITSPFSPSPFMERGLGGEVKALKSKKELFQSSQKTYDIIFNNTFDERDRKRHALMLDLMNHPLLKRTTALFLGRGTAKNVAGFQKEINEKGLEKRTHVVANIKRKEVPQYLSQCRIGVHLALQENGCRALYEYLRSDLPCVISTATAGMNMEIITPETGMAVSDDDLPEAIQETLEKEKTGGQFSPAEWFKKHAGSHHATRALNMELQDIFQTLGYTWQQDIVPLTSSGLGRYAHKTDYQAFKPHFDTLKKLFLSEKSLPIILE